MSMYDMANMRKLKTLGAKVPDIWTAYLAFDEAVPLLHRNPQG